VGAAGRGGGFGQQLVGDPHGLAGPVGAVPGGDCVDLVDQVTQRLVAHLRFQYPPGGEAFVVLRVLVGCGLLLACAGLPDRLLDALRLGLGGAQGGGEGVPSGDLPD